MNYIKIKVLTDFYEVLSSSIYLSGKEEELEKEVMYNCWGIMLEDNIIPQIETTNLDQFLSELKMYDLLISYIDENLSVSELEYIQAIEVLKEKRLIPELIIKSITNSTQLDLFLACGKNGSQNFLLKPGDSIDIDAFWGGDHIDVPVLSKLKGCYNFCNFTVMLEEGYPDYYTKCFSGVDLSIGMHNSNQDQIESDVDSIFIKYSGCYLNNDEYGFKCCSDYLYSQVVASASDTIAFHIDIRECELPIKENPDKMMQVKFFCFYTHE